jgi:UDP-glucose 4-epimerase
MKNKTEVIIVTGSSGMIDSALIHKLAEQLFIPVKVGPQPAY